MRHTVITQRDGTEKRFPAAEIHNDGTIWVIGKPLLDNKAAGFGPDVIAAWKASRWSEIPSACLVHMGENASGLIVRDAAEVDAERRKAYQESLTPAQIRRQEIHEMFSAAERKRDYPGEYFPALHRAEYALEQWRKAYPEDAKQERVEQLRRQAQHQRDLAVGALGFSADGWIDEAGRQKRHDEFIAKAEELEREARDQ